MKRTIKIFLLLTLVLPVFAGGEREIFTDRNSGAEETSRQVVDIGTGKEIRIDLRTGGSVSASGWDKDQAEIIVTRRGDAVEYAEVKIDETFRGATIQAYFRDRNRNNRGGVDLTIRLPRSTSLSLETMGGDVELTDLNGSFDGRTLGGNLKFNGLKGSMEMETLGGDVEIRTSRLEGDVKTLGGDIILFDVAGSLDARTLGGEVIYNNTADGAGDEPLDIESLGGNIEIDEAPAGISASTLGGHIRVSRAAVFADVDTLGGNIRIDEINGWASASTMGGDVEVTMTGDARNGRRDATLSSLGGDVTLTVPPNLSMDISITLEQTADARRQYAIHSDFPLEIDELEGDSRGNKRGVIYEGTGRINGGEHRITLSTINGNIYLKKGR